MDTGHFGHCFSVNLGFLIKHLKYQAIFGLILIIWGVRGRQTRSATGENNNFKIEWFCVIGQVTAII